MTSMWISPVLLERLAGSLLHFIWQGATVALVAVLTLRLLRHRPAEWRYAAAGAGLFAMLAAPFFTFAFYAETGGLTLRLLHSFNAAATTASPVSAASIEAWTRWIVFAWVVGVLVFLTRLVGGWLLSRRVMRAAAAVVTPVVTEALQRARAGLNYHRKVRLLSGAHIETPIVIGWLRPAILLPASALTGLSADHLLAILAHELAHIRRYDFLVNGVQRAVECVLFYHPGVWWISRRMRIERELCCDDLAVRVCGNRFVYANALVELENTRADAPLLALPTGGAGVANRVRRILGIRGVNRDWQSVAAAMVFAAILVGAGMWRPPALTAAAVTPVIVAPPPVPQMQVSPVRALVAIATGEGVRAAEAAQTTSRVTQPTIAASREAARDKLGMLRVEYSAESFVKQAAEGDTIAIKTFLAAGMNINARNEQGVTALMKAAAAGHTETVQSLMAAGANPNLRGEGNYSALSYAAELGDVSMMKVLIAGGAEVDLKVGYQQATALILAAANGRRDAVILLLDNKASIEAQSDRGTALVAAASNPKSLDVVRTLLDRGADVNAATSSSNPRASTALHAAATYGGADLIKLLLDRGADINAKGRTGTPLMSAISGITTFPTSPSAKTGALLLIERGADVNAAIDGTSPLWMAVSGHQTDVVRALLAKGADPNKNMPLFSAIKSLRFPNGSPEIAILLIDRGADVNATHEGTTPLLLAIEAQQIDIVRALLAKGADPNAPNSNRRTPLQAAAGKPEILQLLISAGAK
jgi:ankyrin repeat protein/beta-lactamase regulating signal transducer with metallopeptidase domain